MYGRRDGRKCGISELVVSLLHVQMGYVAPTFRCMQNEYLIKSPRPFDVKGW